MAPKTGSIKKNFIMNAVLSISAFIFPLISFPYVSRVLGPEGTGKVSVANSLVSYFLMFAQLGIPTYGVRACAQVRDDREALSRTAQELLIINLVMSAVSYMIFFTVLILVPSYREDRLLYLVVSMTIFFNAIGMEWLYKGLEQYSYITMRSLVFKLVALVLMFVLVRSRSDVVFYGFTTVLAASASGVMNLLYARKYIMMRPVGGYRFRRHLKAVGIFFAMACASTVYTHLDVLMLDFMTSKADVGYYNAAVRIKAILVGIVISLGTVLLPRASYYVEHHEMEAFRRISGKALNFVFLFASPLALFFILFARHGIIFLSGNEFVPSIEPMRIIMLTLLFIGLTNILGIQILVPTGREKTVLCSMVAGAVTDLILNALLIPRMKSSGAAAGTLAAEAVVLVWQYTVLRREICAMVKEIRFGLLLAALAAGSAAALPVLIVMKSGTSLQCFLAMIPAAFLFFGVYGAVLLIGKESLVCELLLQLGQKYLPGRRDS